MSPAERLKAAIDRLKAAKVPGWTAPQGQVIVVAADRFAELMQEFGDIQVELAERDNETRLP